MDARNDVVLTRRSQASRKFAFTCASRSAIKHKNSLHIIPDNSSVDPDDTGHLSCSDGCELKEKSRSKASDGIVESPTALLGLVTKEYINYKARNTLDTDWLRSSTFTRQFSTMSRLTCDVGAWAATRALEQWKLPPLQLRQHLRPNHAVIHD
jgi:hypothetical protein